MPTPDRDLYLTILTAQGERTLALVTGLTLVKGLPPQRKDLRGLGVLRERADADGTAYAFPEPFADVWIRDDDVWDVPTMHRVADALQYFFPKGR
jgi:hypothetical protein